MKRKQAFREVSFVVRYKIDWHQLRATFCVKLVHNGTETFKKLTKAYGGESLSRAQVFRPFKPFSDGQKSIKDDPRLCLSGSVLRKALSYISTNE